MKIFIKYLWITCFTIWGSSVLASSEILDIEVSIKDHKFEPEITEVPSGVKIRLTVKNLDDTIEEFDSVDLRREKIIAGNSQIHVTLAPLKPGKYCFVGEFHHETAKGCIIAK